MKIRWRLMLHGVLVLPILLILACGPKPPVVTPDKLPGADTGEHFLVQPTANAEGLLGREVTRASDGGWVIADALAPGCERTVRGEESVWTRKQQQAAERVAGLSVNVSKLGKLMTKYEKRVRMVAEISNTEILRADLKGTCGELVITTVKVGTGKRELQYHREVGGGAKGGWSVIGAEIEAGSMDSLAGSLTWERPQAWAFSVGGVVGADDAEISIIMPERLKPGEQFAPEITAGERDLWLVVISCDDTGQCAVLRPSSKIPTEVVPARQTMKLWPMEAMAASDGGESREKMIVYGFPEEGDFKQFKPPAGALSSQEAAQYRQDLEGRLKDKKEIPTRRWTQSEFGYVVEANLKAGAEEEQ